MVKIQGERALSFEHGGKVEIYSARSASRPFLRHIVIWSHEEDDVLLCSCEGWQVHSKCWHQDELRAIVLGDDVLEEHPEDAVARAHLVDVHNIDTTDTVPAQRLLELRSTGECTHHVEGFDT